MEAMRLTWTDDRIDDLKSQVDDLSRRMDAGFREVREEMSAHQRETNARFDSLQRTMIQFGGVMVAALVGLIATQLGLILTQL
jgi:outer membrane cobalamin receptor